MLLEATQAPANLIPQPQLPQIPLQNISENSNGPIKNNVYPVNNWDQQMTMPPENATNTGKAKIMAVYKVLTKNCRVVIQAGTSRILVFDCLL